MSRRTYPCFMIAVEIGSNPKVARLTDREFRCLITGIWALAAKGSPRGYLAVAGEAADERDVAHQARCSVPVARATLARLRDLGMLERDEEMGLEYCHDWHTLNPDPSPSNTPEAWRERKRAQRERERDDQEGVTRDMPVTSRDGHGPKGKETKNTSSSGAERADKERAKASDEDRANCRLFAELGRVRNEKMKVPKAGEETSWLREMRLLRERDGNTAAEIERLIRWLFTDPCQDAAFWGTTIQAPSGLREHFPQLWSKMTSQPTLRAVPTVESSADYLARRGVA